MQFKSFLSHYAGARWHRRRGPHHPRGVPGRPAPRAPPSRRPRCPTHPVPCSMQRNTTAPERAPAAADSSNVACQGRHRHTGSPPPLSPPPATRAPPAPAAARGLLAPPRGRRRARPAVQHGFAASPHAPRQRSLLPSPGLFIYLLFFYDDDYFDFFFVNYYFKRPPASLPHRLLAVWDAEDLAALQGPGGGPQLPPPPPAPAL